MGEMIGLSINVFKHDAERFMRLFQVFAVFILSPEIPKKIRSLQFLFDQIVSVEKLLSLSTHDIMMNYYCIYS